MVRAQRGSEQIGDVQVEIELRGKEVFPREYDRERFLIVARQRRMRACAAHGDTVQEGSAGSHLWNKKSGLTEATCQDLHRRGGIVVSSLV